MINQVYTPKQDYKVLVSCFTYNQSKYIEDALEGFAMQQTNFPFVCLVMDDCSTDGEQEVIKAWMERECDMEKAEYIEIELSNIILVTHKKNENCSFAFYLLKQNLYGNPIKRQMITPWENHCEYEALCEGDDYWTHPEKFQRQVSYLDAHPECSICGHNSLRIDMNTGEINYFNNYMPDHVITMEEVIAKWFIPTQSIVWRLKFKDYIDTTQKFYNGDYNLHLSMMSNGNTGYYFSDAMGAYRYGIGISSTTSTKRRKQETIRLFRYFDKRTNGKYHELFEKRIKEQERIIDRYEYTQTLMYKIKWKLLLLFAKLLHFDENKIQLNLSHEDVK